MVVMEVGDGDGIQVMDSAIPKVRGDYVFANIDAGGGVGRLAECGNTAGIHEYQFAIGKGEQDGIALADIDGGKFECAGLGDGGERVGDQDGQGDERGRECCETNSARQADGGNGQANQEGESQPERRIGDAVGRLPAGVEGDDRFGEVQKE